MLRCVKIKWCNPRRKVLDRALGRRICEQDRVGTVGIDRGCIDEGAAWLHMRHSGLDEIKHGMNVDLERQLPLLVGDVCDVLKLA